MWKNGHPLLGLSCKVFTFDRLFGHRSDFFNSLAIFFDRPEDNKNRCLSSSTNSVGLHFHEGVEKTKENDKNNKNRTPTIWEGTVGDKNLKKNYNFFKFKFEIAFNGYSDKFLTWISLDLPKEVLNGLLQIQFTIGTNFWNTLYTIFGRGNNLICIR